MYQQYIGGKLVTGLGKPLDVLDPSTGEVVGTVGSANAAQAQQALDAAAEAFKTWSKTPLQTRSARHASRSFSIQSMRV